MWAVLTRLEDPKKHQLSLVQKMKLYDGKTLPGFTQDNIKELRKEAMREGMDGISPRYIQDKISNALVSDRGEGCVNPFMVMNELESGLRNHSLITNDEQRRHYGVLLGLVKQEYEDIVKNEVQRAISADEEAIAKLCANYIDNIKAYTQKERVKNKYTGQDEEPDERLMRSIEEKIDIPDSRKDDFRREIMNYIGALAIEGRQFDFRTNERLQKALELKLFEDQKDSIKLTSAWCRAVVDRDTQEKIDVVKNRMIAQLRLLRDLRDRRAQLRREHLRARRRQGLARTMDSDTRATLESLPTVNVEVNGQAAALLVKLMGDFSARAADGGADACARHAGTGGGGQGEGTAAGRLRPERRGGSSIWWSKGGEPRWLFG